jgi:AraC-like DNA-binding protein
MGRLELISDWIELARQAHYSSDTLAVLCSISPSQLRRFFNESYGRPPQEWLSELRLWHAMERLCAGAAIKEVAADLHFGGSAHFCHQFKRYHGCTPKKCVWLFHHRRRQAAGTADELILPWKIAKWRIAVPIRRVRK